MRNNLYFGVKRLLDIVIAIFAITIFLPILLLVSIFIKLDGTCGPILADTPKRVGQNGKMFFLFKFRSMVPNAHKLMKEGKFGKDLAKKHKNCAGKLKVDEDPRITRIGKFIRKWDIDEMPQFFNVLKGEMSIVGPRAYYKDELEGYKKKYPEIVPRVKNVLSIKPGITGPWQVSGRNELSVPERINLDADYALNRSIFYDLFLMLKTPLVVIFRIGAW